ncbi:T9SS type A sorting domain-containing protein [Flavobacterium pallidum]|nr:T9SS type A sorting domain-containing protein [Flavobacterium pallidum]
MKTKNLPLISVCILYTVISYSQLYVGDDTNIYIADKFVYVKKDIKLDTGSNLYLRNESQLLQGTSSSGSNSGNGKLSLFQEGTVDGYKYNYWCAPVGDYATPNGNGSFWIDQFYAPQSKTNSTQAMVIDDSQDGVSNPLGISSYWIFKYLQQEFYEGYAHASADDKMKPGEGFTMKGTIGTDHTAVLGVENNPDGNHQRYDFRGRPNDGTIDIYVEDGMYTLTGNPYPSAIDLSAFLTDATNCTGIAYFWEQDKNAEDTHNLEGYIGGYGSFSPVSRGGSGVYVPAEYYVRDPAYPNVEIYIQITGNYFERRFTPISQGFMIEGNSSGNIVQMKNTHRVFKKEGAANLSQFDRNANHQPTETKIASVSGFDYSKIYTDGIPQIRFKVEMNNKKVRELALVFDPKATNGVDHAMDARLFKADYAAVPYFILNKNEEYVIDAVPFNAEARIPFGFRNREKTQYKISVKSVLNFNEAKNIYLHDKKTGRYYNLQKDLCELTLPAGTNNADFEITFTNSENQSGTPIASAGRIHIVQSNEGKILSITNENADNLESIELFDTAGKLVFRMKNPNLEKSYEIPTAHFADGIYIVRTTGNDGTFSKKISIKN